MYQFELLTNFNTKKTNQTSSARTLANYAEPEFSYNDVLQNELFRSFRQRKRSNSNNSRNNTTSNTTANLKTSSLRSISSSNHGLGHIPLTKNYPLSYNELLKSNYNDIMDYVKQLIDEKKVVKGDANDDGVVDLNDLKTMVDRMFDDNVEVAMKNVDFDGDGKISLQDISEVIKIIVDKNNNNNKTDDPVQPEPPEKQILKGDVDDDGKITQKDLEVIRSYYIDHNVKINMDNADIDDDGKITAADISTVMHLANKYDPKILKGDVNGDGKVNYKDVKALELNYIGLDVNIDKKAADIDDDGNITITDTLKVRKLANEYENKFQSIRGDSNGDGIVDERDFTNIKNFINNTNSSDDFVMKNSDINGDGEIDSEDLKRLRDIIDGFKVNYSETTNLGDIDGDGFISIGDAVYLRNYINRIKNDNEFFINNADLNKDGKIDMSDVTAIQNLLKNVRTAKRQISVFDNAELTQPSNKIINKSTDVFVLEQKGNAYKVQYMDQNTYKIGWVDKSIFESFEPDILQGDANNDGKVNYKDVDLILRKLRGENVAINIDAIDTDNDGISVADAVRLRNKVNEQEAKVQTIRGDSNGDGIVDQRDYDNVQNFINDVKSSDDFIRKNSDVNGDGKIDTEDLRIINEIINPLPPPDPKTIVDPPFTSGIAIRATRAWNNPELTVPYSDQYEGLDANEKITIKKATLDGEAFLVEYKSIYGYKKIRWVKAEDIVPLSEPDIPQKLKELRDYWIKIGHWTDGYSRSKSAKNAGEYLDSVAIKCKEFASYIFNILYGVGYIGYGSTRDYDDNWRLRGTPKNVYQVDEVPETRNANDAREAFRKMFENSQAGDFMQIKRGHGGAHSAIVLSKDEYGVTVLEANADGHNTIQEHTYSWDDLVKTHHSDSYGNYQYCVAISLYRAQ